jgi:GNAT superfamily N-acetyltransferase
VKILQTLNPSHARNNFDCGSEPLNRFLARTARQHNDKGISRTFVLIDTDYPATIIGFFTLSLCEARSAEFPSALAKKYPPVVSGVKLARLAVAKEWQRQGIGQVLIVEAMRKTMVVADNTGTIGLFVDAKDELAAVYYSRYDFIGLVSNPLEMFLPLGTIARLLTE